MARIPVREQSEQIKGFDCLTIYEDEKLKKTVFQSEPFNPEDGIKVTFENVEYVLIGAYQEVLITFNSLYNKFKNDT
jgi:hypothetical protein